MVHRRRATLARAAGDAPSPLAIDGPSAPPSGPSAPAPPARSGDRIQQIADAVMRLMASERRFESERTSAERTARRRQE